MKCEYENCQHDGVYTYYFYDNNDRVILTFCRCRDHRKLTRSELRIYKDAIRKWVSGRT